MVGGDVGESKPTERTSLIRAATAAVEHHPQTTSYNIKRLATVTIAYCRACSWLMTLLTLLFYVLTSSASVAAGYWLAEWSNAEGNALIGSSAGNSSSSSSTVCDQENGPSL